MSASNNLHDSLGAQHEVRPFQGLPSSPQSHRDNPPIEQHTSAAQQSPNRRWVKPALIASVAGVLVASVAFVLRPTEEPIPTEGLDRNTVVAEDSPTINPSPALEMFIPALDMHAEFEEGPCRVKDGAINPETMDKACTYTSDDKPYSLPGTNADDIVVISGHTGAGVPAVFNDLYDGAHDEHKVHIGDKLYLRTVESQDTWLMYTATDLHSPNKTGLATSSDVWGDGPTPGRLLTISCIQPANPLAPAVRNSVVGWQYDGTATSGDM